jgi:hypothetical protein
LGGGEEEALIQGRLISRPPFAIWPMVAFGLVLEGGSGTTRLDELGELTDRRGITQNPHPIQAKLVIWWMDRNGWIWRALTCKLMITLEVDCGRDLRYTPGKFGGTGNSFIDEFVQKAEFAKFAIAPFVFLPTERLFSSFSPIPPPTPT